MRATVGVAFVVCVAACQISVGGAPDDGFRAKLAAGCNSQEACSALYDAAEKRWETCMGHVRGRNEYASCNDSMQDRFTASELKNRQQEAYEKNRRNTFLAAQQGVADAAERRRQREQAERAVTECLGSRPQVLQGLLIPQPLATAADRTAAQMLADGAAANVNDALDKIRQCDPALTTTLEPQVQAWRTQLAKDVADDEACRSTPACMKQRREDTAKAERQRQLVEVVPDLCQAVADRRVMIAEMARERANPSGIVDRQLLHDDGARLQSDNEQVTDLTAHYIAITHKPFSETVCPKQ